MIEEADKGKKLIEQIIHDSSFATGLHTAVFIFPEYDEGLLNAAYKYLNDYLTDFFYEAAVFITSIDIDENRIKELTSVPSYFASVSENDMEGVIRFAAYAEFGIRRINIFSLNLPHLKKARNLIGLKGTDIENLVCYSILGMYDRAKGMRLDK